MRTKIGYFFIKLGEKIVGKQIKGIDVKSVEEILISEEYRQHFNVREITEKTNEWTIELEEKAELIPKELKGKEVVLNGFLDKIEIIDYPLKGKLLYLQFFRRRWKEKGQRISYSNNYNLHPEGAKVTSRFGDFLKELRGQERSKFFSTFPNLQYIIEKDI